MRLTGIFLLLCVISGCDSLFLGKEPANTPLNNFESLWSGFDRYYGMFELKSLDWDSVYQVNRPRAENIRSDDELYQLFVDMLTPLNDAHVGFIPIGTNLEPFGGGVYGTLDSMNDFHLDVVKQYYLDKVRKSGYYFTYGWVGEGVGYLHIEGFGDLERGLRKPMDEVIDFFREAESLIIDVRGGYGGEDIAGQYIASRFTEIRLPYMITRIRNGPDRNDLTNPVTWYIEPKGDTRFTGPIYVLTHRFTISARETFCLAMKVLPDVTFIGDTTAGAFSNQINRELPNGWAYSVSIGEWRDAEGLSHEGIGLIPDERVRNSSKDLLAGRDAVLDQAILRAR